MIQGEREEKFLKFARNSTNLVPLIKRRMGLYPAYPFKFHSHVKETCNKDKGEGSEEDLELAKKIHIF